MRSEPTGLVEQDRRTHIQAHAPAGTPVALCGIGVITQRLPRLFQPGDPINCPACEALCKEAEQSG